MKTILITGGAGFIGSNFIGHFLRENPEWVIVNLDALTYAGDLKNLREVESHPRYRFVHGNICDTKLLGTLFTEHDFRGVVHFAAESHVDNSIAGPSAFVETNINGTFALLEETRQHWLEAPFQAKAGYKNARFLHISTDEVYGTLGPDGMFSEHSAYAPNSPYSASKAAADMLVRSYHQTYGLNTVITNCSNNYGPHQHAEKLIPTVIRKALAHEPIPIYGDGSNVRDWIHVLDHCEALSMLLHQGGVGESYNIGADNELSNLTLAQKICELLDQKCPSNKIGSYSQLIEFVTDRAGHDWRYAVDSSKIVSELDWSAQIEFTTGLADTVEWYVRSFSCSS